MGLVTSVGDQPKLLPNGLSCVLIGFFSLTCLLKWLLLQNAKLLGILQFFFKNSCIMINTSTGRCGGDGWGFPFICAIGMYGHAAVCSFFLGWATVGGLGFLVWPWEVCSSLNLLVYGEREREREREREPLWPWKTEARLC